MSVPSPVPPVRLTRRESLALFFALGLSGSELLWGCRGTAVPASSSLPDETPSGPAPGSSSYSDNVDALFDVLIPAERDAQGVLLSPGAREAGADQVLQQESFVRLAIDEGLLPPLSDAAVASLSDLGGAARATLNAALDLLAQTEQPLTAFRDLTPDKQLRLTRWAFDDAALSPVMQAVRAAAFVAFLGAEVNDLGLRYVGFPPFENFADGLAVSGYPRTSSGRLVDAAHEDLRALAAQGLLDDYSYNQAPLPTPGDDLSGVVDASGDLL